MSELAEKIRKLILFEKEPIYRNKLERVKQYGRVSAFRDVLSMLGENPYFEVHEQALQFIKKGDKDEKD